MPLLVGAKLERTRIGKNFYDEYILVYKHKDKAIVHEKVSLIEYGIGCKKLYECGVK